MAIRAVFLILSTYTFVAAIQVMPIADALAIAFVEPFILLILGRLLFGDEVGPRRIAASVVGFGGALLVIQPSLAGVRRGRPFPAWHGVLLRLLHADHAAAFDGHPPGDDAAAHLDRRAACCACR